MDMGQETRAGIYPWGGRQGAIPHPAPLTSLDMCVHQLLWFYVWNKQLLALRGLTFIFLSKILNLNLIDKKISLHEFYLIVS